MEAQQQDEAKKIILSKEEALEACADKHSELISCFKTCSFVASFTGCCTEEHKVFWECYTGQRGTNQTKIASWLGGITDTDIKPPPK